MVPFGTRNWGEPGTLLGSPGESDQLPDLLSLPWAQHLKRSGKQAVLVGIVASPRGAFPWSSGCLLWVRMHLTSRLEVTASLT